MTHHTINRTVVSGCVAVALTAAACSGSGSGDSTAPADSRSSTTSTATPQPTAPDSDRVDLIEPTFSDPTAIDNPLMPISELESAILLGNDEGHPIRIETVLLPERKVIDVDGQEVETRTVQFVAFLDGRIHEVATDWYGQDDDGNVWYFGEDVYNYEDGTVADTEGTWIAGEDGPPGMIMPADPQVGQVYRPENIPGSVFEEVTVRSVDVAVEGPRGPLEGAMVGEENHVLENSYEDKTFAPGYGEFRSGVGGNLEALAIGVPTDSQSGGVPAELRAIADGARDIFDAAGAGESGDWRTATAALGAMNAAWRAHQADVHVPPLLAVQMDNALDAEMAALDLELQFRPATEVDVARFRVWADQLAVDSTAGEPDPGNVAGDVSSLEWVWDRIAHTLDRSTVREIEGQLDDLRTAADDEDVPRAAELAPRLVESASGLSPSA